MSYVDADITAFNGGRGYVEITLTDRNKKIVLEMSVYCAKTLMKLARKITHRQREFARWQENIYLNLKDESGYDPSKKEFEL